MSFVNDGLGAWMAELATGLVAALVGGVAGFVTSLFSNLFERRREIDESVRETRLQVYEALWRKFGFIPKWPRGSVTPAQLQQLSGSLRDWYFGTAPETALGGMCLSTKSRERYNQFQTAIQDLAETADGRAADDPISDDDYDQLQDRVSALRSAGGAGQGRVAAYRMPPARIWPASMAACSSASLVLARSAKRYGASTWNRRSKRESRPRMIAFPGWSRSSVAQPRR
jgi:hypothetical protein